MTETGGRSWKQTTFHPFAQASRFAQGDVLRVELQSPTYETAKYGDVPVDRRRRDARPESGE